MNRRKASCAPLPIGVCVLALAICAAAPAANAHGQTVLGDPALEWRTIETEHFSIVYPAALEELARQVVPMAERAYEFWATALDDRPTSKTYVVLADDRDTRSASVRVFPYDLIVISHPTGLPRSPWEDSPWDLEELIRLLYGQIAVEDQTSGLAADLRGIIGKLASPGMLQPLWLRRGLPAAIALDRETAADELILLALARSGRWPTLSALSAPSERVVWPPVESAARAVGAAFLRDLAEARGKTFVVEWSRSYATEPLRALSDDAPLQELYREFRSRVEERAARLDRELEAGGGATPRTRLGSFGFLSEAPVWSPDGSRLVYLHRGGPRAPGLREIDLQTGRDRALLACECGPPVWLYDGTILYPKLTSVDAYRRYFDLYRYDPVAKREERLTYGERIYALAPFPGGSLLVARNEHGGGSSIAVLDLEGHTRRVLWRFGPDRRVHSLAVSPDGGQIAVALRTRGAGVDVFLIENADEGRAPERWVQITQDPALDLAPAFSPDGKYVLFSSDRSGRFEIYAARVSDGALFQVTRSRMGSFAPAVSPDGRRIAFVGLDEDGDGFSIYETPYEPARWTPVSRPVEAPTAPEERSGEGRPSPPVERYDPAPALLPTYWLPLVSRGHIGLVTGNADPLRWHAYRLSLGMSWHPFELLSEVRYRNNRLGTPHLTVDLTLSPLRQRQEIAFEFPFGQGPSAPRSIAVEFTHEPGISALTLQGHLLNLQRFDLFERRSSLTVQGGLAWLADRGLSRRLSFDWEERVRLPVESEAGPHELVFRIRTAWSEAGEFSLGGLRGGFPLYGFPERSVPSQVLTVQAEYRFPLWAPGWTPLGPLTFDLLRGRLLVNAGTGGSPLDPDQTEIGFGMELDAKLLVGYGLAEGRLRLGWAYGLGERNPRFYAMIGREF